MDGQKTIYSIKNFLKWSRRDKRLFYKAYFFSGVIRGTILVIPFKRFKAYLGHVDRESPYELSLSQYKQALHINEIVTKACSLTPWQSKCLVRALVTQHFLKTHEISSTLYLGVRRDEENKMAAHAWLRCGKLIVTGKYGARAYQQVAKFAKEV